MTHRAHRYETIGLSSQKIQIYKMRRYLFFLFITHPKVVAKLQTVSVLTREEASRFTDLDLCAFFMLLVPFGAFLMEFSDNTACSLLHTVRVHTVQCNLIVYMDAATLYSPT